MVNQEPPDEENLKRSLTVVTFIDTILSDKPSNETAVERLYSARKAHYNYYIKFMKPPDEDNGHPVLKPEPPQDDPGPGGISQMQSEPIQEEIIQPISPANPTSS